MKDKAEAQIPSPTHTRDTLAKMRKTLNNKINGIVVANGINLRKKTLSSETALATASVMVLDAVAEIELRVIVDLIRSLKSSATQREQIIKDQGPKLNDHGNLTNIKGIGSLGASIRCSAIESANDSANEGKLAVYFLGIVPRVQNSHATERLARITKRGPKLGRTTLVQCALIAKRYSPIWPVTRTRFRAATAAGKPIIALPSTFPGTILRTLKNERVSADFPNLALPKLEA